jgi:SAM-dependent methyltransferase/tetratricopeptide (TPR) repeat protein
VNDGNEQTCPTIFHITHWKAGSQWVYKILRECTPDLIVAPQVNEKQFLNEKLLPGKIYPTVYVTKEQFDCVELPEDWRRFIVFRDLRDTLISGYFSMKISHPVVTQRITYRRQKLQDLNQEDGLIFLMDEFLIGSAIIQQSWLDAEESFLRYEDMIARDLEILPPVLLDQCQLPVSRERLEEVIIANRFDKLSGGRAPGQEDVTSHARKGIAGDWKNYFTPRVERIFNARFGDLLVRAGYEVSENYSKVIPGFSTDENTTPADNTPDFRYEGLLERTAVQLNVQNDEVALNLLDEAAGMKPDHSAILYGKALALTRLGEIDQAALCLDRVLTDFPGHRKARYLQRNIAHLLVQPQPTTTDEEVSPYPHSPVTGSTNVRLESEIDSGEIVEKYQRFFDIDVSPYFNDTSVIKIFECLDSGYRFYYPFNVLGDSRFYEQLQKFPWYYMDWKWEYQIAQAMIDPDSALLEIGCGNGKFLEHLREKGITVTGMEMNKTALNVLKGKGIDAVTESIQAYAPNHKEAFHYVCCFQVLEHIPEVKEFLESAIDVLKPGGKLILSVPNNDAFMFKKDENQLLNRPPHHMGLWNHRSLMSLCRFFPLRLEAIEFEPVQSYHVDIHKELVEKALSKSHVDDRSNLPDNQDDAVAVIVKLFTDTIPGHSILASYTKAQPG